MFASPTSPQIKIIDFGLSKKYLKNEILSQTVGTVYTMAPEVILGNYGERCDVWSTGVLAFMLLSSSLPFFGKSRRDVIKKIMDGKFYFKSRRWKNVSQQAKDFVTSLLVHDVNRRPSCDDALSHKWFHGSKTFGDASDLSATPVVSAAVMDRVQATIQVRIIVSSSGLIAILNITSKSLITNITSAKLSIRLFKTFAGYSKLKKLALLVIAHKSSADEVGFLQQLFRNRFDVVKDGVISFDEFKKALSIYSYNDDELKAMFNAIDIDGCEDLAYSEFLAATIEAHGTIEEDRIAEAFDRLDVDDTGYITVLNLVDFLGNDVPMEFIDEVISEADVSKDHKIDYKEFLGLWDGCSEKVFAENLKDVRSKRLVHDSEHFQALEEGEDGEFLEEEKIEDVCLKSAPPGAGKYFFDQEKEKSTRGIWF